jgi:hypothetical protein
MVSLRRRGPFTDFIGVALAKGRTIKNLFSPAKNAYFYLFISENNEVILKNKKQRESRKRGFIEWERPTG